MADQSRDALDRFWDDLVRGQPSPPDVLDPALADAVRGFHAARDVDGPSPAFVARLREDLTPTSAVPSRVLLGPLAGSANGRVPSTRSPAPSRQPVAGPRWAAWLPRLLAAAVLVLSLGLGAWAVTSYERGPGRLGGIPAVVVEGTALPDGLSDAETLVEVAISEGIPAGDRTDLGLMLDTIPPGTVRKSGLDQAGCCPGWNVNVVLTGTATVRADGPMQYVPTGGSLEPVMITAGTDVVIGVGDTLVYRQETAWEWTVAEGGPMTVLWGVAYGGIFSPSVNMGFGHPEDSHMLPDVPIPGGGFPIRIWRATLEPGATLRPEPGASQLMVADPAADARIGEGSGNTFKNLGSQPVDLYVMTLTTSDPGAASPTAAAPSPTSTP